MAIDLDPANLRAFVATVRMGSISRAAVSLSRTQPGISQQLRRLEDIVGQKLLHRTPHGVSLTKAGERLLSYADRILALGAEAVAGDVYTTGLTGRCGIGLMEDFLTEAFSDGLAEFARRHPNARLEIVSGSENFLRSEFDKGRVHFLLGDRGEFTQASVYSACFSQVWAAAADFSPPRNPLPVVLFSEPCRWRGPAIQALERVGRTWRIAYESTSLRGIVAGLRAGLGCAPLLPATVPGDLLVLAASDGLPPLADVQIDLLRHVDSMADPLSDAVEATLKGLLLPPTEVGRRGHSK